jgi:hypothetical protein
MIMKLVSDEMRTTFTDPRANIEKTVSLKTSSQFKVNWTFVGVEARAEQQ